MRYPLLFASVSSMTAAAALSPVMLAGAGGWVGAALCSLGSIALIRLRDGAIEHDVRHAPQSAGPAQEPDRLALDIEIERQPAKARALVPIIREGRVNSIVPDPGTLVSFQSYDWEFGELRHEGAMVRQLSSTHVKVQIDEDLAVAVPIAGLSFDGSDGARS